VGINEKAESLSSGSIDKVESSHVDIDPKFERRTMYVYHVLSLVSDGGLDSLSFVPGSGLTFEFFLFWRLCTRSTSLIVSTWVLHMQLVWARTWCVQTTCLNT
jgi:hypothetical protein